MSANIASTDTHSGFGWHVSFSVFPLSLFCCCAFASSAHEADAHRSFYQDAMNTYGEQGILSGAGLPSPLWPAVDDLDEEKTRSEVDSLLTAQRAAFSELHSKFKGEDFVEKAGEVIKTCEQMHQRLRQLALQIDYASPTGTMSSKLACYQSTVQAALEHLDEFISEAYDLIGAFSSLKHRHAIGHLILPAMHGREEIRSKLWPSIESYVEQMFDAAKQPFLIDSSSKMYDGDMELIDYIRYVIYRVGREHYLPGPRARNGLSINSDWKTPSAVKPKVNSAIPIPNYTFITSVAFIPAPAVVNGQVKDPEVGTSANGLTPLDVMGHSAYRIPNRNIYL